MTESSTADFGGINDALFKTMERAAFGGHDPFDMLNSRILQVLRIDKSRTLRLAAVQFGKHSPVNFRPLLGVPKLRNPKGIGLIIMGLLNDYQRTGNEDCIAITRDLGRWLVGQQSDRSTWTHSSWGYHFDWQARAFFVPKGKPNIITTCYVARALLQLGQCIADDEMIEAATSSADFIVKHLLTHDHGATYFSYVPGETAFVHNASLWGAAWCAQVGSLLGRQDLLDISCTVAAASMAHQAEDGSWAYGLAAHHGFVDGFHTGYNLEALTLMQDHGVGDYADAVARGFAYYKARFIEPDGFVKYYSHQRLPYDTHNVAQAMVTLLRVGGTSDDKLLAKKVLVRAIDTLHDSASGRFYYQDTKWGKNKVNYSRWTQAWAYYAISALLLDARDA